MEKLLFLSQNCSDLGLSGERIEAKTFPDGESYVRIGAKCEGKEVVVVQRCYPDPDRELVRLVLAISQAKEMGAKKVTVLVPYLPYARQDKRFLDGEAVSSEIVCGMLANAGCSELTTFDCHFMKKEGETRYGGLKIKSASLSGALAKYFEGRVETPLFISPDQGAAYMVGGKEKAMKKVRGDYIKGETAYREVKSLEAEFEVKGRNVVILDDIVAGGGTMIRAVAACRKMGARSVRCGCVHGLFLNRALQKILDEGAVEAVATDTIVSGASAIGIAPHVGALL